MIPKKPSDGCPSSTKDHHNVNRRDEFCCCDTKTNENQDDMNDCCWDRCWWQSPPSTCLGHSKNLFWKKDKILGQWTAQESRFLDEIYCRQVLNKYKIIPNLLYQVLFL